MQRSRYPFLIRYLSILRTPNKALLLRSCLRSATPDRRHAASLEQGLGAAYRWIVAAQDATPDDGVSAFYDLLRGWSASYPEVTGYIIPTLLTYASLLSEPEARRRAIRMADWEIEVQLPTGAVRSGTVASKLGPAVFNTGQVLHGWTKVYEITKDEKYAAALQRAARWLLLMQDDDGAWRMELSVMTSSKVQTYNVRTAWGLAIAGELLNEPAWIKAACKNADWCLKQRAAIGWFDHNGFTDDEFPLLHTIAYTLEGLAGIGILLRKEEYANAALLGVHPLQTIYAKGGKLGGRYAPDWRRAVSWRCLTGEAQIALVLLILAKYHTGDAAVSRIAMSILEDLAAVQDTECRHSEVYGGLAGSEPIWGEYRRFCYLSWAVKFYMDALLLGLFDAKLHGLSRSAGVTNHDTPVRGLHAS